MGHYYTNDDVTSVKDYFTFTYQGHDVQLISDNGVFSKHRVDYGTRVLLDTLEVKDAKRVLDVGCGYGAIGLSLKAVYPDLVIDMVDVNRRALALTAEACERNVFTGVKAFESDGYAQVTSRYDLILSNPPIRAGKAVVMRILSEAYDHLEVGGRIIVVIQKKQGAPSARKKLEETFGNCEILRRDKGYYILQAVK